MGSGFKNLFFGKSSSAAAASQRGNPNLKGYAYDKSVASEPPVKGSYPVAGNGPNVLDQIQRSRARRDSRRQSRNSSIAPPPNVPRQREDAIERPRTAPHNGAPGGGYTDTDTNTAAPKNASWRTRSGFSMKSPPSFLSSNRRNSIKSTAEPPPIPNVINKPTSVTVSNPPPPREVQSYRPRKGPVDTNGYNGSVNYNGNGLTTPAVPSTQPEDHQGFSRSPHNHVDLLAAQSVFKRENGYQKPPLPPVPPAPPTGEASHSRSASVVSRRHVDLLELHSNINPSQEASKHRAKASGVRNYGEDVADRNIAEYGDRDRDHRLDLNAPEFAYLKTVYAPKKRRARAASPTRVDSALGHVLGHDGVSSDDILQLPQSHARTSSIRSTATASSSRPGPVYPPRWDSTSVVSFATTQGRDADRSVTANGVPDGRRRAMSPLSMSTASINEESGRQSVNSTRAASTSTPPIPARGRRIVREPPPVALHASIPSYTAPTHTRELQYPVLPPAPLPYSSYSLNTSVTATGKERQRKMSTSSQNETISPTNRTKSRNGSVSYSAFPSTGRRESQTETNDFAQSQPSRSVHTKQPMIVEGAKEPPSLKGVVDLSNTVDTDVTTKTLPAVTQEHVIPTRHEIRKEVITREIHTHDVFHRILPVIETEILPPKHYVPSLDGKGLVEIPENMVPGRTANGSPSRNWEIRQTEMGKGDHGSVLHQKLPPASRSRKSSLSQAANYTFSHPNIDEDDAADGPVIPMVRNATPRTTTRSRTNSIGSTKSHSKAKTILEPILSSKKEYITKEGHPKTEYVWRHPPVFEDAQGRTQPVYLGAGLGDLSAEATSDDEDLEGAEFGAMRGSRRQGEESLLFRDSGYGTAGMLPGLKERSPLEDFNFGQMEDFGEKIRLGRVLDDENIGNLKIAGNKEGEATKALRRMKERRRSSVASSGKGERKSDDLVVQRGTEALEMGVNELSLKN